MNEFEQLVFKMRTAQKDYFKTRDKNHLRRSKELERWVDEHLDAKNNPKLFS